MIFQSKEKLNGNPVWELNTKTQTIRHINPKTNKTESFSFHEDHIAYHLEYAETYYPERLQKLVDEGEIYRYLDDLDTKVTDAVNKQTEIWIKEDKAYQIALDKGDLYEVNRIANMHKEDAKEVVYNARLYF